MATNSENQINLRTLQRVDSKIVEIIDNACQVAIYKYERKLGKWEGTEIEGALFLYRRALYPYYGFIIVNRMSTTNFVEFLTSDMQIQLQEPYLLYQNRSGEIIGSWFYQPKDLQRISKKIQTIILKETTPPRRQRCASESESLPQNSETRGQDIMTLLSVAHEEYIKKSNSPRSQKKSNSPCEGINQLYAYSEEKSFHKLVVSEKEKSDSNGQTQKKYSSEENDPVSPRRRFMSTGSFDPDRLKYLSNMLSPVKLDAVKSPDGKIDNFEEKTFHSKTVNNSTVKRSLSYTPSVNRPSLLNPQIKNYFSQVDSVVPPASPNDQDWRTTMNGNTNNHFSSIKHAIKSHIEENPKVMLKIHEAYVSSLKSLFANSSC